MSETVYVRPSGLMIMPGAAGPAPPAWIGLPLAGTPQHFTAIEVIRRLGQGRTEASAHLLSEAIERDWRQDGDRVSRLLASITVQRPRLAGLSLEAPCIMGIVNVTPDSFSDGGRLASAAAAIDHGLRLLDEGADILDIGGESTRPGADPVPLDEELRRVLPVIEGLRNRTSACLSIDTRKAGIMARAAASGVDILNDVSALTHDPAALDTAAGTGLPVILMHAQGDPRTMNDNPAYDHVSLDVFDFLESRIAACEAAGIPRSKLVADPGIGFGKHLRHNVEVLSALSLFHGLGVPLLLGASRKKIIGQLGRADAPLDRVPGSIAAALAGVAQGVQLVRVHDVAATRQALAVWSAIHAGAESQPTE